MYYNNYGLLNAHEKDIVAENTLLFSVEYVFLCKLINQDCTELENNIIEYIEKLRNSSTTRFNNIPNVTETNDKYISHDQYTALCAFSNYFNLDYHKQFSDKIIFNTYDNISGKFNPSRFIHPRDSIYIALLNDKLWAKLALPLLCLITIVTFLTKYKVRPTLWEWFKMGFKGSRQRILKTDGELLTFVRYIGLKNKSKMFDFTYKICLKLLKRKFDDGYSGAFRFYFKRTDHPSHQITYKINNYILEKD